MARLSPGRRAGILGLTLAFALATPAAAHADPITTAIAAFVNVIAGASVAAAVGNFLVAYGSIIYGTAASWALSKTSSSKTAAARDRQATVQQLSVGETPREALVGEAGTGGSLLDGYWYGGANGTDWNVLVLDLADHRCHSLVGFWEGDKYVAFTGDGEVPGYGGQLKVWFRPGAADDADFPSEISGLGPATAPGSGRGVCKVAVAYKADAPDAKNPIWTTGRPAFLWVVKGLLCYDPRKDDTVPGGAGPHRWNDPSTREWSENAEICRYNVSRGIYFLDQVDDPLALMLGRGLSTYEAPPERVFAPANLCDELVSYVDSATGSTVTEPRYRVGGVISGDQTFDVVEQWFADAMAGHVIQPEGGVAVEPGQAKTPVAAITDADLVGGTTVQWSNELSDADRVNGVVVSYVEPTQKYAMTTAGILRDDADVGGDGGPKTLQLPLNLVRWRSQALRIGEIRRRSLRLEKRGVLTLPPDYAGIEEGDWITYASARRTGGVAVAMRVTKFDLNNAWQNTLALEETAYGVYGFGAIDVPPPVIPPVTPVGGLAVLGFAATPILLTGEDGSTVPAVQCTWTAPVDSAITGIVAQVRMAGATAITPTITGEVNAGVLNVTAGVPSNGVIELRLLPQGAPGRVIVPTAWISVLAGAIDVVPGSDTTPPAAPTSLAAGVFGATVSVTCTSPSDADVDKIEIWRNTTNASGSATRIAVLSTRPSAANRFLDVVVTLGSTYYYWAKALDRSGNTSAFSSVASATLAAADTTPPGLPNSIVVSAFTGMLSITWGNASDADLDKVEVFRNTSNSSVTATKVTTAAATAGGSNRFNDTGATPGVTYWYFLRSVDRSGNVSAFATGVSGMVAPADTTPPAQPSSLTYAASVGSVFITWTNPSDADLKHVEVWEATTNNWNTAVMVDTPNAYPNGKTSFSRSGLAGGESRWFWLRAVDTSNNKSGWYPAVGSGFQATGDKVGVDDFPTDLEPVATGAGLPTPGTWTGPKTFRNSVDGKLYRLQGGAWTAGVNGADVTAGTLTADRLTAGTITTAYVAANGIQAVNIASDTLKSRHFSTDQIYATSIVANEIDVQYLKNGAVSNADLRYLSEERAISNFPTPILGSDVTVNVKNDGGSFTTIILIMYVDALNLDTVYNAGLSVGVTWTGAATGSDTGGEMNIAPWNSNSMCVPIRVRLSANGNVTFGAGGQVTLAVGASTSMVKTRRVKLGVLAVFKS